MSLFEENSTLRILQHFGGITMDNFDDRLRLQKIAYLSEVLGADGGFNFTYYHYGPYSPTLTKILYKGITTQSFVENVVLTEREQPILELMNELLGENITDPLTLELFATIWYLLPSREILEADRHSIINTITDTKPRFNAEQVGTALDNILAFKQQHNL